MMVTPLRGRHGTQKNEEPLTRLSIEWLDKNWCDRWGSTPQPLERQSRALAIELRSLWGSVQVRSRPGVPRREELYDSSERHFLHLVFILTRCYAWCRSSSHSS